MKAHARGFSLLQLLVSLALFLLVLVCIKPSTNVLKRSLVRAELEHIFTIALYLHKKAMTTGEKQCMVFDLPTQSFSFETTRCTLPEGVCFGIRSDVTGPPSFQVTTPQQPITFANNTITFYPSGVIQAGSVYMCDTSRSCLYVLTVPVGTISLLRLYRYDNRWRCLK